MKTSWWVLVCMGSLSIPCVGYGAVDNNPNYGSGSPTDPFINNDFLGMYMNEFGSDWFNFVPSGTIECPLGTGQGYLVSYWIRYDYGGVPYEFHGEWPFAVGTRVTTVNPLTCTSGTGVDCQDAAGTVETDHLIIDLRLIASSQNYITLNYDIEAKTTNTNIVQNLRFYKFSDLDVGPFNRGGGFATCPANPFNFGFSEWKDDFSEFDPVEQAIYIRDAKSGVELGLRSIGNTFDAHDVSGGDFHANNAYFAMQSDLFNNQNLFTGDAINDALCFDDLTGCNVCNPNGGDGGFSGRIDIATPLNPGDTVSTLEFQFFCSTGQRPDRVDPLSIATTYASNPGIILTWPAVTTDVLGNPTIIDHYKIYRGNSPTFQINAGSEYAQLLPSACTPTCSYSDLGTIGVANQNNFYVVSAVNQDGDESDPSERVGTFNYPLARINPRNADTALPFIEMPFANASNLQAYIQTHTLPAANVRTIRRWRTDTRAWEVFNPSLAPASQNNFVIGSTRSFRVQLTPAASSLASDPVVTFVGTVPAPGDISFTLVDFQSNTNFNHIHLPLFKTDLADAFALSQDIANACPCAVALVERFNNTTQSDVVVAGSDPIQVGRSYKIYVVTASSTATWP